MFLSDDGIETDYLKFVPPFGTITNWALKKSKNLRGLKGATP
jgi:hypothetical protein